MDTSIATANKNIIGLLADAGPDGLHTDDILYLLGFQEKKDLLNRLNDLKGAGVVTDLEGDRWRKIKLEPEKMDANTNKMIEAAMMETTCVKAEEPKPKIYLPDDEKFSSYKNTLQEYCQKMKWPVPVYKTAKERGGAVGMVTFNLNHVRSEVVSPSVKEAETRVAFDALQKLGYLENAEFTPNNQLKRKGVTSGDIAESVGKKSRPEPVIGTPKSMLNEYAQKNKKSLPTYNAIATAGGFLATVTFDGTDYKGVKPGLKRRDAEQNAAKVALAALTGAPIPQSMEPIGELDVNQMITEQRQLTQPASLKNRLQEYCQRMGKPLPKYTTVYLEADRFYQSVVDVQSVEYSGLPKAGKKNAEFAAAEVALRALELMA